MGSQWQQQGLVHQHHLPKHRWKQGSRNQRTINIPTKHPQVVFREGPRTAFPWLFPFNPVLGFWLVVLCQFLVDVLLRLRVSAWVIAKTTAELRLKPLLLLYHLYVMATPPLEGSPISYNGIVSSYHAATQMKHGLAVCHGGAAEGQQQQHLWPREALCCREKKQRGCRSILLRRVHSELT